MPRKCEYCKSKLLREIPGESLDFDADPNQGTYGIPLCSNCLGTGIVIETEEFQTLTQEVRTMRRERLNLEIERDRTFAAGNLVRYQEVRNRLAEIEQRLVVIARRGLGLVGRPVPNCLALKLTKERQIVEN